MRGADLSIDGGSSAECISANSDYPLTANR
jgi:hypothetical protein